MKRFFTAMLVLCMIFSLCACGIAEKLQQPGSSGGNAPGQTQPVEQEPERPDEPVETVPQPVELTAGQVEGDVYTNSFFDLSFTLPDGWTFASDTELMIQNSLTQNITEIDLAAYLDQPLKSAMIMQASNGVENVNINITKLPDALQPVDVDSYLRGAELSTKSQFADEPNGMRLVSSAIEDVTLCGETVRGLKYELLFTEYDISAHGLMVLRVHGNYLAVITMTAFTETLAQMYMDNFTALGSAAVTPSRTAPTVGGNGYSLSALPGTLQVPDGYHVYALDSGYTEEMCKKQGIEKSKMDMYLQVCGSDMIILPENASFVSPEFTVNIRVKGEKDYGIENLKDLSETEFSAYKAELLESFSATGTLGENTAVYENDSAKYIVFDWTVLKPQRRYATILNGKMVYFYVETDGGAVTSEQEALLRQIIDTLQV